MVEPEDVLDQVAQVFRPIHVANDTHTLGVTRLAHTATYELVVVLCGWRRYALEDVPSEGMVRVVCHSLPGSLTVDAVRSAVEASQ